MPRRPRLHLPSLPQHIIQRGNNREPCFRVSDDHAQYLHLLALAASRHECRVHAYVLMTNHVHLLVTGHTPRSITATMHWLSGCYVQYFNRRHGRSGTLWEGRYRASLVDDDDYLLRCMRYIELNPVRAGMVHAPDQYRWSSFRRNALGAMDPLIDPHPVYQHLGKTSGACQHAYNALFSDELPGADIEIIRNGMRSSRLTGGDSFRAQVAALLGPENLPRPPGRPRSRDGRA